MSSLGTDESAPDDAAAGPAESPEPSEGYGELVRFAYPPVKLAVGSLVPFGATIVVHELVHGLVYRLLAYR